MTGSRNGSLPTPNITQNTKETPSLPAGRTRSSYLQLLLLVGQGGGEALDGGVLGLQLPLGLLQQLLVVLLQRRLAPRQLPA